jgi:DNA-binding MarR family transcriptional regulator
MGQDLDLSSKIWAAINLETMKSRAWAYCFPNDPDLKFDEYRQVIFVVMFINAVQPGKCILSRVQKKIANAYNLDAKTVLTKIQRLVDDKFFEIQPHPEDKRMKCVRPTQKLVEAFEQYNTLVQKIVNELQKQMKSFRQIEDRLELEQLLRFNILDSEHQEKSAQAL